MITTLMTSGEPAGVGPDLVVRAAAAGRLGKTVVLGAPEVIAARAEQLGKSISIETVASLTEGVAHRQADVLIFPLDTQGPVTPGVLSAENIPYVFEMLETAGEHCLMHGTRLITLPVHKAHLNSARPFMGHTEFYASQAGVQRVVMMLASRARRVALVTTHLPLSEVPSAITPSVLKETLQILVGDLQQRWGIPTPKIGVCGLNPHAGESGTLGVEEREIIAPCLEALQIEGAEIVGPLPADTAFTSRVWDQYDCLLAMYHDQGLAPIKAVDFGETVNVTLGLPYVRVSVDHGTALDIAGTTSVDPSSLYAALDRVGATHG